MIPAALYDGATSAGTLIANIRLSTEGRAAFVAVRHKLDARWIARVAGDGGAELRVRCEGITTMAWIGTLYSRFSTLSLDTYHVALADGDSHTGLFGIEELAEDAAAEDRRRFRLVLLSSGLVTYSAAP